MTSTHEGPFIKDDVPDQHGVSVCIQNTSIYDNYSQTKPWAMMQIDFLSHLGLLVISSIKRLHDSSTHRSVPGTLKLGQPTGISSVQPLNRFADVIKKLTSLSQQHSTVRPLTTVVHSIITAVHPNQAKARRLGLECYLNVKQYSTSQANNTMATQAITCPANEDNNCFEQRLKPLCPLINDALESLSTNASADGMGTVLQKYDGISWNPFTFFHKKIRRPTFHVLTNHKALTMAFRKNKSTCSPMQPGHLDFIAYFTPDLCQIKGEDNLPVNVLSRNDHFISGTVSSTMPPLPTPQAS
ncbi:unnamed protein product [Lepeophtheirus salmonis]|uniref:(salmon louse) hypothetical protein n=1 Tax=Lepeophtheirus salmonis TaxID=72036 RepID=A0A7R8CKL3_LEPSM|nr:unnamed protein product [Lepeophtheirus salmonis]CAF2849867.1 unnamed protein product [Lepeophtheirus salmonis]